MNHLRTLATEHLAKAAAAASGRSAVTLSQQGQLRQTLVALTAGAALQEHEAPPAATLQVLQGGARLTTSEQDTELVAGDLTDIPQQRHALEATDDTVAILTVLAG